MSEIITPSKVLTNMGLVTNRGRWLRIECEIEEAILNSFTSISPLNPTTLIAFNFFDIIVVFYVLNTVSLNLLLLKLVKGKKGTIYFCLPWSKRK